MTIAIYAASVALATLCIVLFFVAGQLLSRQEEIVTTMLRRYDERLADFAQTLNDALNRPPPTSALVSEEAARAIPEHGVMRLLELEGTDVRRRRSRCRLGPEQGPARDRRSLPGGGGAGRTHGSPRLPGRKSAPGRVQR